MRRILVALALASLPAVIAAQNATSRERSPESRSLLGVRDGLRSAAVARRLADHLHARLDRQDQRQARIVAVDHERRRRQEPLPRSRQRRALVAERRSHRLHRAGRSEGLADLRPLHGRGRRDLADHAPHRIAGERDVVAGRPVDRVRDEGREEERRGRSRCRSGPKAPSGSRRRASSSGSTIARTDRASTTMASVTCSRCRRPAARRGSSPTAIGITTASSSRPTASRSSSRRCACPMPITSCANPRSTRSTSTAARSRS